MHYFIKKENKVFNHKCSIDNNKFQITEPCYINVDTFMLKRITLKLFRFYASGADSLPAVRCRKNKLLEVMVPDFKLQNPNNALL